MDRPLTQNLTQAQSQTQTQAQAQAQSRNLTNSDEQRSPGWSQLILDTCRDQASLLEEALFASGALSVQYQDLQDNPVLEPAPGEIQLWDNIRLTGLFADTVNTDAIVGALSLACDGVLPDHRWCSLVDQVWERTWMDRFQPMQFGPKLWICPTYCDPVDTTAINVRLDPGLAFGTGTHETTKQCLEWLGSNPVSGTVLDYGCGSGVLAVAAAMVGADRVIAVDIDPQAITATRSNAEYNAVLDQIEMGHPDDFLTLAPDIVLANILFQPLMELAQVFAKMLCPGAVLVMSGILEDQVDAVRLRYNQWFSTRHSGLQGGWAVLELIRNGS